VTSTHPRVPPAPDRSDPFAGTIMLGGQY